MRYRVEARNIQVINDLKTKEPTLILEGDALELARKLASSENLKYHISISHEDELVTAIFILEKL